MLAYTAPQHAEGDVEPVTDESLRLVGWAGINELAPMLSSGKCDFREVFGIVGPRCWWMGCQETSMLR